MTSPPARATPARATGRIAAARAAAALLVLGGGLLCGCGDDGAPAAADAGTRPRDSGPAPDADPFPDGGGLCVSDEACDDGDFCDGPELCDPEIGCFPTDPPDCDDGLACTADACDDVAGACSHVPDDGACDDGLACNGAEVCVPGEGCAAGAAPTCDDAVACTADACDASVDACVHVPDDGRCDDGLACNGAEVCGASGCEGGPPVTCDDGVACTLDGCVEPAGVCAHVGADSDGDGFVAGGCLAGDDCDDRDASIHPGALETCDGVDESCDGLADDGFECPLGSPAEPCTTACGTAGTRSCTSACTRGPCVAPDEVCGNGCDDDADGSVDEDCGPANDLCEGALALSSAGTRTGTLVGATAQTNDCGSGVEVFYRVVVTSPSLVYLSTVGGSTVDTRISYRGLGCGGSAAQCVDDACGGLQSHLAQHVGVGTHTFAVHTYAGSTAPGSFDLAWRIVPTTTGAAVHVPDAPLASSGSVLVYLGSTTSAGALAPTSCGGGGAGDAGEAVYYWAQCPSDTRTYRATTCASLTDFDTTVWTRFNGVELSCDDDDASCASSGLRSTTSATATGAGLVEVFVDGHGMSAGAYELSLTL